MSSNGKKDYRFDNTILDSMQEPLTVRVEKIRGTASIPIDLPPQGPDLATGQGWDKDGIRNLERWLVTEWSGGGFYHVTVSDTTSRKMEWRFLFDTREFPERTPPTMLGGLSSPNPIPLPPRQQQVSNPSNNGPSNTPWVAPQQQQQQPQSYGPTTVAPPTPSWGPYWQNGASGGFPGNGFYPGFPNGFNPFAPGGFNGQTAGNQSNQNSPNNNSNQNGGTRVFSRDDEAGYRRRRFSEDEDEQHKTERRQLEQRTRELEASLQRAELERKEADYKSQLDKAQAEAQRQIDLQRAESEKQAVALREELRKLAELSQRPKTDPEEDRVKEAIRKEEDRLERERIRLENERREEKFRMEAERAKMEQERRDEALRVEQDRAKLEQTRRDEALRAEAVRRDEAVRADNERRFNELQLLIAKVTEANNKPSGPDPAIVAMQESQKALQEELRRERERAEADRREREREERARIDREAIKEDIRRREEDSKRREDLLMAQMNEIKSSANKGPDPVLAMMQESMRMQVESMKDVARAQQSASEKAQAMSLSPRDLITLMNDKSSGIDQLTKNVVGVYNDMFQTQRQMIEMAAQLTGGGESTTTRLIETGLSRASEAFDRYMRTKRDETVSNAKAAEAQAQAQSQAFAMQQQRLAQMARAEAATGGGFNGPTLPPQAPPSLTQQIPAPQAAPAPVPAPVAPRPQPVPVASAPKVKKDSLAESGVTQAGAKVIPLRRLGKTDEQWFGPALLERINQLRSAVKDYFESISAQPARLDEKGEIVGIDPEGVVDVLSQAVNIVLANNMNVPAVSELFLEKRYADLMDILIPDATQPYKDDCVALLMQLEAEDGDPQVSVEEDEEEVNE